MHDSILLRLMFFDREPMDFNSYQDFQYFYNQEKEFWSWAQNFKSREIKISTIKKNIDDVLQFFEVFLDESKAVKDDYDKFSDLILKFRKSISKEDICHKYILSSSTLGLYLKEVIKLYSEKTSLHVYKYFLFNEAESKPVGGNRNSIEAVVLGTQFRSGNILKETAIIEKLKKQDVLFQNRLEGIINQTDRKISELVVDLQNGVEDFHSTTEDATKRFFKETADIGKEINAKNDLFGSLISRVEQSEEKHQNEFSQKQVDLNQIYSIAIQKLDKNEQNSSQNFSAIAEKFEKLEEKHNQQFSKHDNNLKKIYSKAEDQLENYKNSIEQKIVLNSSISYWSKKNKTHKRNILFLFFSLIMTLGAIGYLFSEYIYSALDFKISEIKYSHIAMTFFISTVGIWIIRFQAKVLTSNLHMQADSFERITMLQTYISLVSEGDKTLNDEDRKLILQIVFRPTVDGFVRDDGPNGMHDYLGKILTSRNN